MNNIYHRLTPSKIAAALLVIWCITGIALFRDYAVSWDEPAERKSGICSDIILKEHIAGRKIPQQYYDIWQGDRFYGLIFQHILLGAEKIMTTGEIPLELYANREVWHLRHFINFFTVAAGLLALYLCAKMVKAPEENRFYPVFVISGFMLMPRFFAESFYNVKDVILLAGFMFAGYALFNMMKKRDMISIALCAFVAAFVSAIRLQGAVFFLIGVVRILTYLKPAFWRRIGQACFFTLLFTFFLILFYPVSWENPAAFFVDAVKYMSSHPWRGHVLFMGEKIISTGMPWYYIAVWMAVTIPVPLFLLGVTGTFSAAKSMVKKSSSLSKVVLLLRGENEAAFQFQVRFILLAVFWGGLLFFSLFSKVLYNGWRHYYFLAWPLLFLIADGVCFIWDKVRQRVILRRSMITALTLFVFYTVAWNINAHPYQHCYFNFLAGNPNNNFETDYWRLSNLEAFRKIAEYSKANNRVSSIRLSLTCYGAMVMLPQSDWQYLKILNPEEKFEFYVWFDRPADANIRKDVIFEEKYCSDLLGQDVHLYTTLKLR